MEQKKINERITLSLLQQCALVWEYCSKSEKEGEFSFADVYAGTSSKLTQKVMEKTGYVEVNPWSCQWPKVLKQKMQAIDGMACYDEDEGRVRLFFETDEQNPGIGFSCGFMLRGVFDVARGFAQKTGCQALTRKAVFGYKDGERWARVPSPAPAEPAKPAKAKSKSKAKAKSKKKVTITEKQLEKDGVVEFVRKDCYGITYEMKAFRMGYTLLGRVLTEDDRLIFHNEMSFDSFKMLKLAFERTAETMADDEYPTHKKYADKAKEMGEPTLAERLRQALLAMMAA